MLVKGSGLTYVGVDCVEGLWVIGNVAYFRFRFLLDCLFG